MAPNVVSWHWDCVSNGMSTLTYEMLGDRSMAVHWFYTMDEEGETPMSRAMKSGHVALTEFMLRQEREDTPEHAAGDTLLQRAAYWGMEQAVRKLLAGGADPGERDDAGETPLHKAVRRGHLESVKALIESGADVNEVNKDGMTTLHWVSLNGREDVAELLLSYGADVNARDDFGGGMTPLTVAKLMGYDELSNLLGAHGGHY